MFYLNKLRVLFLCLPFLMSCEKEITVDLPDVEEKLVVEGSIELDGNPIIILTKTTGYFDPTDLNAVAGSFVDDASITISDGTTTSNMTKICSGSLTPSQQAQLANQLGVDSAILQNFNICGYTDLSVTGEEGKFYSIDISWRGESYQSTAQIPPVVELDSTWFKVQGDLDSLGFIWALLSDPPNRFNAYRWFAMRINKYTYGDNIGEQKDGMFLAPSNAVFDDQFFDGLTFDFAYNRSSNTDKEDDNNNERGYYKIGDTIVVKFTTIDQDVATFYDEAAIQSQSNGSPFASPLNVSSNISNGAVGVWAAYGVSYDTIIAQ